MRHAYFHAIIKTLFAVVLSAAAAQADPVQDGRAALEAHNPAQAKAFFQQALDANPDDPEANFGIAMAEAALIVNDPGLEIQDILDSFQVTGLDIYNIGAVFSPEDIPGTADSTSTVQDAVRNVLVPKMDSIISRLENIEASAGFNSSLTPLIQPDTFSWPLITDGEVVVGISGVPYDDDVIYVILVPAGKTSLNITTSGGTGQCHLYVKYDDEPDPWLDYYDYKSDDPGTAQTISIPNPQAGAWYIMLFDTTAAEGFTDVTMTPDYAPDGGRYTDNEWYEVDDGDIKACHAALLAVRGIMEWLTVYTADVDYDTVQADRFDLGQYIENNAALFTLKGGGVGAARMLQARTKLLEAADKAKEALNSIEAEVDYQDDDLLDLDIDDFADARAGVYLFESALNGPTDISNNPADATAPVVTRVDLNAFFTPTLISTAPSRAATSPMACSPACFAGKEWDWRPPCLTAQWGRCRWLLSSRRPTTISVTSGFTCRARLR